MAMMPLPEGFTVVSMPDFIRPSEIPIGGFICGRVDEYVGNFTDDEDLDDTWNFQLAVFQGMQDTKRKILFPVTGTVMQTVKQLYFAANPTADKKTPEQDMLKAVLPVSTMICLQRNADGQSTKYGKAMFRISLAILKK